MPYIRISHFHCMSNPSSILIKSYFSSPEPKAHVELIVYQSSRRLFVRPSTLLNINISESSGPIATKFYLKHYLGGERLHYVLGQIGLELWFAWQRLAPIGLKWGKSR